MCHLSDLLKEKASCCLKTDFVGGFRPFPANVPVDVDVSSGNYDIRFLRPQFYKESVLSNLCGVAVWSDLILNFEGIVAGIELSAKTQAVFSIELLPWPKKLKQPRARDTGA